MKNPVRFLNLMLLAVKAINAVKKAGEEEGFRFFLNLLGLQSVSTPTSAKPVEVLQVVKPAVAGTLVPTLEVSTRIKPGTVLSIPKPAMPMPAERPARVMTGSKPQRTPTHVVSGDFAAKLNGAATKLGLENRLPRTMQEPAIQVTKPNGAVKETTKELKLSPIDQFRKVLGEGGHGKEYWDNCRKVTGTVLADGLHKEVTDWKLLVGKMEENLFLIDNNDRNAFLASCPKDVLSDFVLGLDGLTGIVAEIKMETSANPASVCCIDFIIDACMAVGEDARILLINCKHAVNRMKQLGFIGKDHWLVAKVAKEKIATYKTLKPSMVSPKPESMPVVAEVPSVGNGNGYHLEMVPQTEAKQTASAVAEIMVAEPEIPGEVVQEFISAMVH